MIILEPMTTNDIMEVADIRNSCREFLLDTNKVDYESTKEWFENRVLKGIEKIYLAYTTDIHETVGYVNYIPDKKEHGIKIKPEHRGKGYGKQVLEHFIKYLMINCLIKELNCDVRADNPASVKLHEGRGFKKVGEVNKDGLIIYKMRWER